jgi:hypothetical protein
MNRPDKEREEAQSWIAERAPVAAGALSDEVAVRG